VLENLLTDRLFLLSMPNTAVNIAKLPELL